jgi:hypothetical protein
MSSITPAHLPNQISKGCQLNSQKHTSRMWIVYFFVTEWPPFACKLYLSGHQSHANCTRVDASRIQISGDFIHVACYWRLSGYNLHATGGHSATNYMGRQSHPKFACASGQLRAKPPVFCKHAARTSI